MNDMNGHDYQNKSKQRQYLSIASMNCRGLAGSEKRRDVLHFLRKKKYSIYCLQDVHFEKDMENKVRAEWGLNCFFSSFKTNARGVVILFNNNFEYKVHSSKNDKNGNLLALDIQINDNRITLVNIYGPNNDTPDFFDEVQDIITEVNNPHTIICGDWNLIMDGNLDCQNYVTLNNPNARERVLNLCNEMDLTDPWRIQNPNIRKFTWRQHDSNKQARLDFFLISAELNSNMKSCDIKPGYRTDHSLIDIQFDFSKLIGVVDIGN
jgi:exonuclease III